MLVFGEEFKLSIPNKNVYLECPLNEERLVFECSCESRGLEEEEVGLVKIQILILCVIR